MHSMRWRPVPAACPLPRRLFAILSINFLLFAGANLLHMPALASLTLNHWHPQWWQVRLALGRGAVVHPACWMCLATAQHERTQVMVQRAPGHPLHRFSRPVQFVTATFMHANWQHLSSNAFALLVFGRMVEEEEGALGVWLTYLLAGVGGTLASYLTSPHTHTISLGASGAVFGLFMVSLQGSRAAWLQGSRAAGTSKQGWPAWCEAAWPGRLPVSKFVAAR